MNSTYLIRDTWFINMPNIWQALHKKGIWKCEMFRVGKIGIKLPKFSLNHLWPLDLIVKQ